MVERDAVPSHDDRAIHTHVSNVLPSPDMVSRAVTLAFFSVLPGFSTLDLYTARIRLAPVFVALGFVKQ